MKEYQVFYWLKMNRREHLRHMFVRANNAREACAICKRQVYQQTGRNAFRPTTKVPELDQYRNNPNFEVD